jgi:hypothetical protein
MQNPYQPPQSDSALLQPDETIGATLRALPRSFWYTWFGWLILWILALVAILFASGFDRFVINFIGWPLMGLFLAPFVLVRAKLCEKYQHRCMASSGVMIFLAGLGVCFGVGYACMGIWFGMYSVVSIMLFSWSMGEVQWIGLLFTAMFALVVYLKLIDMSAKRPRLE